MAMKIEKLFLVAFSILWLVACYQVLLFVRVQASSNNFNVFQDGSRDLPVQADYLSQTKPQGKLNIVYLVNNWTILNFINCPTDILEFLQEWSNSPSRNTKTLSFSNWDSCLSNTQARTGLEKFISSLLTTRVNVQLNRKDSQTSDVSFVEAASIDSATSLLDSTSGLIIVFNKQLNSSIFDTKEHLEDTASKLDSFMDSRTQWTMFMEPFSVEGEIVKEITTTYLPVDLEVDSQLFILYKRESKTLKKIQDLQFPPNCQVVDSNSPQIGGKLFFVQPLW